MFPGPGRIEGMATTEDQLQCAVDDLLGAPRDEGKEKIRAAKLSGIRELYLMLTGDQEMRGGYKKERVHLATTADFTGLVKNALNKMVADQWMKLGRAGYDWWKQIVQVEHFGSLNGITGTLIGTVGSLPVVAEGGEYTELAIGDSPETASFVKYGGYIPLTLELIDRDETRKLRAYPFELASAGMRKISALVAAIFTDNAGVGPTLADTGALFNATAVTTAGGHANLLTTGAGCCRMGSCFHGGLQPADADQKRGHLLRHRAEDGAEPEISRRATRFTAHGHEDHLPHPGKRQQHLQRELAAGPAWGRGDRPRMD